MIAKFNNMDNNSGPGSKGIDFMYEGRLIDDDIETEGETIGDQAAPGTEIPSQLRHGNRWKCLEITQRRQSWVSALKRKSRSKRW
jgi:hypothetical protein